MEHCQLCSGKTPSGKSNAYFSKLPQIVSNCKRNLSKDIYQLVNWNFSLIPDPFCGECVDITLQLLQLEIQLEQIQNQTKQLTNRITEKIVNKSRHYEQPQLYPDINFPNYAPLQSQTSFGANRNWENQIQAIQMVEQSQIYAGEPISFDNIPVENSFDDGNSSSSFGQGGGDNTQAISGTLPVKGRRTQDLNQPISEAKTTVTSSDLQLHHGKSEFWCSTCNKKFSRLDILKRHNCESQTFACDVCQKSFSSQGSLKLHSRLHTGEKPYSCEECGKSFAMPHHLRLHIRTHTGERPYECEICHKSFRDIAYIKKHRLLHSNDEKVRRSYSCDICSKSFTAYNTLKKHVMCHTGDTPHKCQSCGKAFGNASTLKVHEATHAKEKTFQCTLCWKRFVRADYLKTHMLRHSDEKKFQCETCGKGYNTKDALTTHINLKHGDEGEFICDICGKLCKTQLQLNYHLRNTHTDKPKSDEKFKCVVCGNLYTKHNDLLRHQRRSHVVYTANSITCQKCHTEFEDHEDYHRHLKRRMAKAAKFRFHCEICKEVCPSRCLLTCHFAQCHKGAQFPHKCDHCPSTFLTKSELLRHRKIHSTIEKPHVNKSPVKHKKKITSTKSKVNNKKKSKKKSPKVEEREEEEEEIDGDYKDDSAEDNIKQLRRSTRARKVRSKRVYAESDESNSESSDNEVKMQCVAVNESFEDIDNQVDIKNEVQEWIKQEYQDYE